jgi:hypothetical protein
LNKIIITAFEEFNTYENRYTAYEAIMEDRYEDGTMQG